MSCDEDVPAWFEQNPTKLRRYKSILVQESPTGLQVDPVKHLFHKRPRKDCVGCDAALASVRIAAGKARADKGSEKTDTVHS